MNYQIKYYLSPVYKESNKCYKEWEQSNEQYLRSDDQANETPAPIVDP